MYWMEGTYLWGGHMIWKMSILVNIFLSRLFTKAYFTTYLLISKFIFNLFIFKRVEHTKRFNNKLCLVFVSCVIGNCKTALIHTISIFWHTNTFFTLFLNLFYFKKVLTKNQPIHCNEIHFDKFPYSKLR